MFKEFEQINKKFNDDTYPIFPFISKSKITLLEKGLYRKHNASFRGVTAVFNTETNTYEFPLYGMYEVSENIVIVPEELVLNRNKQIFLDATIKAGYKLVRKTPKFETIKFPEDSTEARLALANKAYFNQNPK